MHRNVMFLHTSPVLLKDYIPVNHIFWGILTIILVFQGRTAQSDKNVTCGRLVCDIKISAKELIRSRSYDLGTLCQNVRIKVLQVREREAFVLGALGNREHCKQSCLSYPPFSTHGVVLCTVVHLDFMVVLILHLYIMCC
jgi:hypothetical protein